MQGESKESQHSINQSEEQEEFISELKTHNYSESQKLENTIKRMEREKNINERNIARKEIQYAPKEI